MRSLMVMRAQTKPRVDTPILAKLWPNIAVVSHGAGSPEHRQIPLDLRGQIVSVHDYYRTHATQQTLLGQGSCSSTWTVELHPHLPVWQGLSGRSLLDVLAF
jgi:hypothetical protein